MFGSGDTDQGVMRQETFYSYASGNLNTLGLFRDWVLRSGGKHSVGVVKRAGSFGLAVLRLPIHGFSSKSSIHIRSSFRRESSR